MSKHAKTPCPGREVATFGEAAKREQQGDTLTGKQNSSTTVGKSRCGLPRSGLPSYASGESDQVCKAPESRLLSLAPADDGHPDCLLSLLLMTAIWSSRRRTVFCHYCWGQSGLSSLTTSDDGNPDSLLSLATAGDDLDCLEISQVSPKCWARGLGLSHENFSQFHPRLPPQKPYFCSVWRGPPPGGFLLSTLAPKWTASTLTCLTQHCVPVSHLLVPHQDSTSTPFGTA